MKATASNGWTPDQVLGVLNDRLISLENEVRRELSGFPESYATKLETDILRSALDVIRSDHVARRELEELKSAAAHTAERLQVRLDEANGRRQAGVIGVSVLATVFAVLFGIILNNQITHAEISNQIKTEAPWVTDQPAVDARITELEKQNANLVLRLAHEESLSRFFCRTRTPQLPGC